MKCLSGRQPWWWAILEAGKRIENRVWNTSYRGPILLHAAKGCTVDEYEDALVWMENRGLIDHVRDAPPLKAMQRGGIVGRARIAAVLPPHRFVCNHVISDLHGADTRWHMPEQYGFVLVDVEPLPFTPMKGALGLFEVPEPARPSVDGR